MTKPNKTQCTLQSGKQRKARARIGLPTTHPDPEVEAALLKLEAQWVQEKLLAAKNKPV